MPEHYRLHVNGTDHDVADAWVGESLLFVLRERVGLLGTKGACEQGECGSCSVARRRRARLLVPVLAAACRRTGDHRPSKGSPQPGTPSDVQPAFVEFGGVQCGFCTPGLVMAAHALARPQPPSPTETQIREELSGNICRCTGYGRHHRRRRSASPFSARRRARGRRHGLDARSTGVAASARRASATACRGPTASPRRRARSASPSDLPARRRPVGSHVALAAPVRAHRAHRPRAGVDDPRRRVRRHRGGRPGASRPTG